MNFIKPKDKDNFLIICERCKAIINYSKKDCYCIKEADEIALQNGNFQNITRIYIDCPNCANMQDVAYGLRYSVDNNDFR